MCTINSDAGDSCNHEKEEEAVHDHPVEKEHKEHRWEIYPLRFEFEAHLGFGKSGFWFHYLIRLDLIPSSSEQEGAMIIT
jgi:hypothetical protein